MKTVWAMSALPSGTTEKDWPGKGLGGVPDGGDPVVLFDQGDGAAVQVVLQNLVAGVEVERVAVQGQGVGQGGIFFGICLEQQILILYQLTGHGCTAGGGALASGVVQQDGFPAVDRGSVRVRGRATSWSGTWL